VNHARHYRTGSRRRSGAVVGLAATAGGMIVAALAQLAAAPAAGADVTDVVTELDATLQVAQTALTNASDSFVDGNVPNGLDYGFGALNTYLLSTVGDLAYGGYESLEGVSGPYTVFGFYYIDNPAPTTLAEATADATTLLGNAQTDFAAGASDFASGDIAAGATDSFYGLGLLLEAPEVDFIGLTDTLLGSV
jgi:hypothetical protein